LAWVFGVREQRTVCVGGRSKGWMLPSGQDGHLLIYSVFRIRCVLVLIYMTSYVIKGPDTMLASITHSLLIRMQVMEGPDAIHAS
jgi:hypothetical protein